MPMAAHSGPVTSHGMRRALFLDRDGVINIDKAYVHRIEDVEFVDGIFDLCRLATRHHMPIVVVTNQAGIGRGYYSEAQFQHLSEWMKARFAEQQAPIRALYHCPFHPEHGIGPYRQDSFDRKPKPGMLLRAGEELGLALARSVMIGDAATDMQAAAAAGIGLKILLGASAPDGGQDHRVSSLQQAGRLLDAFVAG